ncbi:MAG: ABC transporter permease subunit [Chloroflexi bacterium]|nr:ABC transporter permease subunit [Chloroflexota bacterium]
MGTDALDRDVLSRLIYKGAVSLFVSLIARFVIIMVGVPVGIVSGYFGGWVDLVIQRVVDVPYAFPSLLFIIIIMSYLPGNLGGSDTALAAVLSDERLYRRSVGRADSSWTGFIFDHIPDRTRRGTCAKEEGIHHQPPARSVGQSLHIMMRHILPNIAAPVLVAIKFRNPERASSYWRAGLSYLGLDTKNRCLPGDS